MSDRASRALAEASLPGEPCTYDARSKRGGFPLKLITLYYRDYGRRSTEEKAQGLQEDPKILLRGGGTPWASTKSIPPLEAVLCRPKFLVKPGYGNRLYIDLVPVLDEVESQVFSRSNTLLSL
jgi:hypothetical protein